MKPDLNLFGPATLRTGYGVFLMNMLPELNKLFNVSLTPRSIIQEELVSNDLLIREACQKAEYFDYEAPSLNIWHAHNMQQFAGEYRIGFPIFESTKFRKNEKHHLKSLHKIAVTSEWARQIVLDMNWFANDNVFIINGGVNPDIFNIRESISLPGLDQFPGPKAINIGKWELRKGQAEIIKVLSEVRPELTMFGMWDNPFWPDWKQYCMEMLQDQGWQGCPDSSNAVWKIGSCTYLVLLGWIQTHQQYAEILRKMDFGVFPYRSEGWCLPLQEAMACGLPVVATNYSAPTEYLTDECGILLKNGKMEAIYDQIHFPDGGRGDWMVPNRDELANALMDMMKLDWKAVGRKASEQALKFTWEASIQSAKNHLVMGD